MTRVKIRYHGNCDEKALVLSAFRFSFARTSNQQFNTSEQMEDVLNRHDYINMSPHHTSADTSVLIESDRSVWFCMQPGRGQRRRRVSAYRKLLNWAFLWLVEACWIENDVDHFKTITVTLRQSCEIINEFSVTLKSMQSRLLIVRRLKRQIRAFFFLISHCLTPASDIKQAWEIAY